MKNCTLLSSALVLVLGMTAPVVRAQSNQIGSAANGSAGGISGSYFTVFDNPGPACGIFNYRYTMAETSAPWGSDYGPVSTYYSLPAGTGPQSFAVAFNYFSANTATPNYQVFVDGEYCAGCVATVVSHSIDFFGEIQDYITITHQAGDAWSEPNNGVREFGLRYRMGTTPIADIRFKAVMVGTVMSEVLGHYNAPGLPVYILRDPPGDQSYSSLINGSNTCFGQSQSVSMSEEANAWFKAKLGIAGTSGIFFSLDFELYFEFGFSVTGSMSETSQYEYRTCLDYTQEFRTSDDGTPDDMFLVNSTRYAYGMATVIERPTCGEITKRAEFVSAPVATLNSNFWSESFIRGAVIPDAEEDLALMTPGTDEYDRAQTQIDVWYQMLAMNDSIKANAPAVITRNINGGGASQTFTQTSTTSQTRSIQYTVALEGGLSSEFKLEVGGSGVSGGLNLKMKNEWGNGETNSNQSTNTMSYTLKDADVFDNLSVIVGRDPVLGSHTFTLDPANSRTSCKYEGGFQLDQPSLSVGTPGSTEMTVNEAPIGSAVNFPLILCNNSDTTRTYHLRFNAATNAQGAVMQAFGNTIGSNDNGIPVPLLGGQCINTNLALTQPNIGVLDFDNIDLYLYALCEEDYPPYIRSYVTISAHFGEGNLGNYCIPVSTLGTSEGDYVDGVQLGDINNTGTGSTGGAHYTDYSGTFSTPLSRNAQRVITLSTGTRVGTRYAVWIDYDRSGTFEEGEKLGAFNSTVMNEVQDIAFTVPSDASLGSTLMRVRGVNVQGGEPAVLGPCFNYNLGETEDYTVVINDLALQDCAGVENGPALPGTPCDDGNANTGNDLWNANCVCVGAAVDCAGVPGGAAGPGTPCDDGDPGTADDQYNGNCECAGLLIDCTGIAGGSVLPGTPCNDGNANTGNDVYGPDCQCAGQLIDCLGVIGGNTLPGSPCDDGNPLSGNDAYNTNCQCVGSIVVDCMGVENGTAQPGTPCDDNDANTGADVYGVNCVCAGLPYDCAGTPGGSQLPGTPCDDGNPDSTNDVFTADCGCVGVLPNDCAGVPGGSAQPGSACDDGDATTGNDVYNSFCECAGQLIDCTGTPGGTALPGFPCDDGNAATGNDVIGEDCACAGQLIDCVGMAGGTSLPGTACDDGNPDTDNDVYNANCQCVGTLADDCLGVPGGTAQPGSPCDDGDATTGNDVYNGNCECAGVLIDCAGTIGGPALPGSACNDNDPCTTNDVWTADCNCGGTAVVVGAVNAPAAVDINSAVTLYITPIPGATSYSWNMPGDWTSSNTTDFVLVATTGGSGTYEVCVDVIAGGCTVSSCHTIAVLGPTEVPEVQDAAEAWFTVQPNPSSGVFDLVPSRMNGTMDITVYDGAGRVVKAPFLVTGERIVHFDMSDVAPGAYYVFATSEGRQHVVKVMLQR